MVLIIFVDIFKLPSPNNLSTLEVNNSLPLSAEVKNEWSYAFVPPI
jgi:hypothetical protein